MHKLIETKQRDVRACVRVQGKRKKRMAEVARQRRTPSPSRADQRARAANKVSLKLVALSLAEIDDDKEQDPPAKFPLKIGESTYASLADYNLGIGHITAQKNNFEDEGIRVVVPVESAGPGAIFLSDFETAGKPEWLRKRGINHVISIYGNPTLPKGTGSTIVRFDDNGSTDAKFQIALLADTLNTFEQQGATVLIHCQFGRSRSVTCILYFLVAYKRMGLGAALEVLKKSGIYTGAVNPDFKSYLRNRVKEIMMMSEQEEKIPERKTGRPRSPAKNRNILHPAESALINHTLW